MQIRALVCERGLLNRADGSARWTQGKKNLCFGRLCVPIYQLACLLHPFILSWGMRTNQLSNDTPFMFMLPLHISCGPTWIPGCVLYHVCLTRRINFKQFHARLWNVVWDRVQMTSSHVEQFHVPAYLIFFCEEFILYLIYQGVFSSWPLYFVFHRSILWSRIFDLSTRSFYFLLSHMCSYNFVVSFMIIAVCLFVSTH